MYTHTLGMFSLEHCTTEMLNGFPAHFCPSESRVSRRSSVMEVY